jgi:xylulose-5-phosphate/fructose-6-phosphate phosphoketolase
VPELTVPFAPLSQRMDDERMAHRAQARRFGEDGPDVSGLHGLPFLRPAVPPATTSDSDAMWGTITPRPDR